MRVLIVGAGPAGLYLALQLRRLRQGHEVMVLDRHPEDHHHGWGVVLPADSASFLERSDLESFRDLANHMVQWDSVEVVVQGHALRVDGLEFFSLPYDAALGALRRRCRELGVELRYGQPVRSLGQLADHELVVGADGAGSHVRRIYRRHFRPVAEPGRQRFAWFTTPRIFDGLTYLVRLTAAGTFFAQGYRFDADTSNLIVECSEATYRRSGLSGMDEEASRLYVQAVFAGELESQPLTSISPTWSSFWQLSNERWSHGNVTLVGDALHTTHFSIGCGIRLAFRDAVVLAGCLGREPDLAGALEAFEQQQRPVIREYQAASGRSMRWLERIDDHLSRGQARFAYELITLTRRVSPEQALRHAPHLRAALADERLLHPGDGL